MAILDGDTGFGERRTEFGVPIQSAEDPFESIPVIRDFVVGAQTEVITPDLEKIEIYFGNEVAPGFFAWLVPTTPGKARVGLLSVSREYGPAGNRILRVLS